MSDSVIIVGASEDSTPEPEVVLIPPVSVELPSEWVERIVNLERDVMDMRATLFDAEGNANYALAIAKDLQEDVEELAEQDEAIVEAVDEAIDEVEADLEEVEPEAETEDNAPASAKVHPLFRPAKEWFGN